MARFWPDLKNVSDIYCTSATALQNNANLVLLVFLSLYQFFVTWKSWDISITNMCSLVISIMTSGDTSMLLYTCFYALL